MLKKGGKGDVVGVGRSDDRSEGGERGRGVRGEVLGVELALGEKRTLNELAANDEELSGIVSTRTARLNLCPGDIYIRGDHRRCSRVFILYFT